VRAALPALAALALASLGSAEVLDEDRCGARTPCVFRSVAFPLTAEAGFTPAEVLDEDRCGARTPCDEERAAWAFKRSVVLFAPAPGTAGFASLVVPPELMARATPDLRDIRLVAGDGRELPYVLEARVGRETTLQWSGRLADVKREARRQSAWTVDLGETRRFDRLLLTIPGSGFAKRVKVEISEDGRRWTGALADAGVFDRPWTPAIHHTTLGLPDPVSARFVRLTLDDRRTRPLDVTGVQAALVTRREGEEWRVPAALTPLPGRAGVSRYRVEAPAGLSFEALRLESDDPAFARRVTLLEASERNGRRDEKALGSGVLYRVRLPEEELAAESVTLGAARAEGGERILEVQDGDSPPLLRPRAEISGPAQRLVFPVASRLTLYYGNDATRAPLYDLASLRERLGASGRLAAATLGPEAENPRFLRPAPLPFTAARGARLAVEQWARLRPVVVAGPEDLYTLMLDPLDLGVLRPDLGDLRIVDDEGRQLPYILEADAGELSLELAAEQDGGAGRRAGASTSRYRLTPAGSEAERTPLPLRALQLEFAPAFFSRSARVLAPASQPRERERVVFAGTLARDAGARAPLRVALDGSRVGVLLLEVDEGDNEPLALGKVSALVRVPRVVFKAAAGRYQLLLGNPAASPARYDLASLRREVLSYSAVVVSAGPAEGNAAHRPWPWQRLGAAPPALLLWCALGGAVVALLLLTARILRQPEA
jgi:hypothetical protein